MLFHASEYFWCDAGGQQRLRGNGGRSVHSTELCCSGGSAVALTCHGVCRAAAPGSAGEAAAVAEAAAAGRRLSFTCLAFSLSLAYTQAKIERKAVSLGRSQSSSHECLKIKLISLQLHLKLKQSRSKHPRSSGLSPRLYKTDSNSNVNVAFVVADPGTPSCSPSTLVQLELLLFCSVVFIFVQIL